MGAVYPRTRADPAIFWDFFDRKVVKQYIFQGTQNDPQKAKNGLKIAPNVTGVPQKIPKNLKKVKNYIAKKCTIEVRVIAPKIVNML